MITSSDNPSIDLHEIGSAREWYPTRVEANISRTFDDF